MQDRKGLIGVLVGKKAVERQKGQEKEDGKVKKKVYRLQRLKGQSQEMNIFLKINEKAISTFWRADLNEFKLDYLNCSTKKILPILKILTKTFFILITTFVDFLHSSQAGQRNDGENTTKIFSWLSECFFHVQRHFSVNVLGFKSSMKEGWKVLSMRCS